LQPVDGLAELVHRYGALLVLDCVTSLGGIPVKIDEWDVDIAYSGTQKCLSCPPGLAPITISPRAREVLQNRQEIVKNWYLDLSLVERYWGDTRTYHHTAPISMNFALREALRIIYEEGLDNCFQRHRQNAETLWEGLRSLGLSMHVPLAYRLPTLSTICIPDSLDEANVRKQLLSEYNIEIAGGLGELAGKVWRIGLMGYSSRQENITLLLGALKNLLP